MTRLENSGGVDDLLEHASLLAFSTFGVEATARYLLEAQSVEQLRFGVEFARDNHLPLLVLGAGSNVLFVQNYPGLVIVVRLKGIVRDGPRLQVAAGEGWHELVEWTLANKLFGLENLALIPGTVGAAPIQNIGAYGVEVEHFIEAVTVYDTQLAAECVFSKAECDFGYRDSVFKRATTGRYVVLEVALRLQTVAAPVLSYAPLADALSNVQDASPQDIAAVVCEIRRAKLPDPLLLGNAGSFFKNPVVSGSKVESLRKQGFDVPSYPADSADFFKLPAAWLLERAGWKGKVRGRAAVSEMHALVIVNLGGASGEEIFLLAQEMSSSVLQKFGIALQPEVRLI